MDHEGNYVSHHLVSGGEVRFPMDRCERIIRVFAGMHEWIQSIRGDRMPCVVMEDFAFSQANQMALLGGLGYHIRIMLRQTGWHFGTCPTGTLKKMVTGKGNSGKTEVILGVYKRWGWETNDDNLADAYGLSKIAWIAYAKPLPGTMGTRKADFEALDKLEVYR